MLNIDQYWNNVIKHYKYKHANQIFICMLCTYHTNNKMCIMHRKILCHLLYNTPDLICATLFIYGQCAFSPPAGTFSYFKMILTNIALSDWLNVEVNPEDQSYDSFDEAMVLWLDDHLQNNNFQCQRQWTLCYLSKTFSMLVMDFGAHIKN